LLLPLGGQRGVQMALRELLVGRGGGGSSAALLHTLLRDSLGDDASLYELSALVSEPGSPRQPVHPDNPYQPRAPLLTCFVALQPVMPMMGPTTFLPRTHTAEAHAAFEGGVTSRDALLSTSPHVVACLDAGDASLFDSRTMHCGGANDAEAGGTRVLFYCSFRNPNAEAPVGNVGSLHASIKAKPITLRELRAKLSMLRDDDPQLDPFNESLEEAEALTRYRRDAERGESAAQFNLAMCYRRGEGIEQDDALAFGWFMLAAEAELALGQTQVGFCFYLGQGVQKDEVEASRWFGRAAEQGEVNAQHNLGICYSQGVGVTKDLHRAAELLQSAAAQGHQGAAVALVQVMHEISTSRGAL